MQGSWQQFSKDSKHRVLLQILLPGPLACVHTWALGRTQQTNLAGLSRETMWPWGEEQALTTLPWAILLIEALPP